MDTRSWTIDEKLRIVNEAKTCGDSIALVARRHGMNANHLFNWMQRERDGTLDRHGLYTGPGGPLDFIELGVVDRGQGSAEDDDPFSMRSLPGLSDAPVSAGAGGSPCGRMEIVGPGGRRVIVDANVDVAALLRVLRGLETL
jgi:transposase